jgi:hypothetical protein
LVAQITTAKCAQRLPVQIKVTSPPLRLTLNLPFITAARRIKSAGHAVTQPPRLDDWLNHILRRWRQLSTFWVVEDEALFAQLYNGRPRIGDHDINGHVYFEDWQRYSKKEQVNLPFGGLKGQISYCGDIAQALPLLTIGQHLHIGGKTIFGLGAYQLIC